MNRTFWLFILSLCVAGSADYAHADITLLAGVTKYARPSDGTYWNINQPNTMELTPPAAGIRWDSKRLPFDTSIAVQYTNFGKTSVDALAVNVDAPFAGGYIPNSGGKCVGTCAPLSRWKIGSSAQSVALILVKHLGNFGLEWGSNWYETRTAGYVEDLTGVRTYNYIPGYNFTMSQMFGVSYRRGPWSVRVQTWFMDGPSHMVNGREKAPATFNDTQTWTLLVGYTF